MSQKPPKKTKKLTKYITEMIKVEKFIPGGQALGTLADGKKIFLWGALPGEVVTKTKVTKEKSSFVEGIAEEITEQSKFRVEPRDECYLATSPWQIIAEEYEDQQKDEILHEIFRQHSIEIPADLQEFHITGSDNYYGYRNKMEYTLYYSHEDEQIHLAFHERGSHRKVPIASSSLERPEILAKAQAIVDELNAKGEEARKYQSLLLRCNENGQASGGLFENGKPHPKFPKLTDELFGIEYSYSPNGFFQINLPVYRQALEAIRAACAKGVQTELDAEPAHQGDNDAQHTIKVLDLYSGVGTIGLSVARDTELTLVECDRSAYDEMVANVAAATKVTGNPTIQPVLARSEDALSYVEHDQIVIVDPPRAGCLPAVIEKFLEVKPSMIVYLSCNPATQARDVKKLLEKYAIDFLQPYNFFPRTPHIENLIVLKRKDTEANNTKTSQN